jgi:prolyl oligopeptidase PreP (S9A serine peptidase family)
LFFLLDVSPLLARRKSDLFMAEEVETRRLSNGSRRKSTPRLPSWKASDYQPLNKRPASAEQQGAIAYPSLTALCPKFLQDETHPRGIWRRTLLADYFTRLRLGNTCSTSMTRRRKEKSGPSKEPLALSAYDLCKVYLSRGGSDARNGGKSIW